MSTHKRIDIICIAVTVLALLITALFMNGEALGIEAVVDDDAERNSGNQYFTENDKDGDWSTDGACVITLTGDGAEISGSGAYYNDGSVTIKNAGKYVLSGELTDGSIIVNTHNTSKVWILLDGVTIDCEDDACLIVDQADKVFVTLEEGSENSMTSSSTYSSEALSDNTGGVIFSHDDLTINGSGSLTITGSYKHGIDANDSLVITGGTISITCPEDGLHANDQLCIMDADITIAAGDDGIHTDTSFYMASGSVTITECYEGIEAVTIDVDGGDITLYPTDDGMNANGGSSDMFGGFGGMQGTGTAPEAGKNTTSEDTNTSAADDNASTADNNAAADDNAATADYNAAAADDNAADGGMEDETYIRINGGTVTIINENGRDADGLDSNGSIYIGGGTILISLSGSGGNCALDYGTESGGELVVTGGTLVACGDSSMAEAFSDTCTQCAVLYNLDETAAAGTAFTVTDASGAVLLSYAPAASYSSVAFSCPEMTVGDTYTVSTGEATTECTLESTATTLGSSSGMMGGMNGMNGMGGMDHGEMHSEEDFSENSAFESSDNTSESSEDNRENWRGRGPGRGNRPQDGNFEEGAEMPGPPADREADEEEISFTGDETTAMKHDQSQMPGQEASEDTAVAAKTDVRDLSADTWILLGASLAVLIAGIAAAVRFRRN
ncbi:MAG: carbohydrate-binding domain-containing protein [Lachnospiraceae bacterium]|nr:carbohydrate-binding domain-containing protein [Lachnospiraceae bacterium]